MTVLLTAVSLVSENILAQGPAHSRCLMSVGGGKGFTKILYALRILLSFKSY